MIQPRSHWRGFSEGFASLQRRVTTLGTQSLLHEFDQFEMQLMTRGRLAINIHAMQETTVCLVLLPPVSVTERTRG